MSTRRIQIWIMAALVTGLFLPLRSVSAGSAPATDTGFWNEFLLMEFKRDDWYTYTYAELRWMEDFSELSVWVLQQKVYTDLAPWLQTGGGGAYVQARTATQGWVDMYRAELELNPKAKLSETVSVVWRNRLEARHWQTRDYDTEWVSRHRLLFAWKTSWLPRMTRIEISDEVYYDYRQHIASENQFRPADLFFRLSDAVSLNLFVQIQSKHSDGEGSWGNNYILGSGLRFFPDWW